ncbi:MAG: hypothetical protein DRP63_09655 [Planctomycetota bacterium]|nr:MAG: hypothetical protein DRP63_09655 [Planctomycetota bacterium]
MIINCTFVGNSVEFYGGAIACEGSSPSIIGCSFSGNSTHLDGGALFCWMGGSPLIANCVFSGNTASRDGGAIYVVFSSSSIINCTFSGNNANSGGGAICCSNQGTATLYNSILWGNFAGSGDEIYVLYSTGSSTLNYCCVDNTGYGFASGVPTTTIDDSNNCISVDPQFVDAAGGDYHLKDTSPCIDAGDNSYVPSGVDEDLDGNERIVDGDNDGNAVVDIGAYEHQ